MVDEEAISGLRHADGQNSLYRQTAHGIDSFGISHGLGRLGRGSPEPALLATLAIVIWHMYNAHLNPSKFPGTLVIWNGLLTKEEMLDEHPLEYEKRLKAAERKIGDR